MGKQLASFLGRNVKFNSGRENLSGAEDFSGWVIEPMDGVKTEFGVGGSFPLFLGLRSFKGLFFPSIE